MTRNIGMILLAILLILMSVQWFGILTIPAIVLAIFSLAAAIAILIGR